MQKTPDQTSPDPTERKDAQFVEPTFVFAFSTNAQKSEQAFIVTIADSPSSAKKLIKEEAFLDKVAKTHFDGGAFSLCIVPQKSVKRVESVVSFRLVSSSD